jgi:tRNA-dihydrouridine synthase B
MQVGPYLLKNNLFLAPMAGVSDRPFRSLCKRLGAGYAVSEMMHADARFRSSRKTALRLDHRGEGEPIVVQILGADPRMMAEAARYNVDQGAQIIDINMGCPAKKVCNVAAGSALLKDEPLVARILESVVQAVEAPVTLKIRTGWDRDSKNAVQIAKLAESAGIQMLTVHGRTRACGFTGEAEYDTIAEVKSRVRIPVVANGDITTPEKAKQVLDVTQADAIMIGRGAQGRPWLFAEIAHYLSSGARQPPPTAVEIHGILRAHLEEHYAFYGEEIGIKTARKHIAWYTQGLPDGAAVRHAVNVATTAEAQLAVVECVWQNQGPSNKSVLQRTEPSGLIG